MNLLTLGGLELPGGRFTRPKPLLLLAYLALEGAQDRSYLSELFFGEAQDPMSSLRTTVRRLRRHLPGALEADGTRLRTDLPCDVVALLALLDAGEAEQAVARYTGPFLAGISSSAWSAELEEWVYAVRESVAARVRAALLTLAERQAKRGAYTAAAALAERAAWLNSAPDPEPEDFTRLGTLLAAGHSALLGRLRRQADELGVALPTWGRDAQVASWRAVFPDVGLSSQGEHLRIGTTAFLNLPFLPQALRAFHQAFPRVQITFHGLFSVEQLNALQQGQVDVGFVTLPLGTQDFALETVWQEPYVVLLPEAHPLAGLSEVPLEALAGEAFVAHPRDVHPPLYDHVFDLLRRNGISPPRVLEGSLPQTRNHFVAGGFGYTLALPSWPADLPGLVRRPLRYAEHHQAMFMSGAVVWPTESPSPHALAFVEIVRTLKRREA